MYRSKDWEEGFEFVDFIYKVLFAGFMRIWIIIYFVHCIVLATAMSLVAQLTPLGISNGNVSQCNYQIVLVNPLYTPCVQGCFIFLRSINFYLSKKKKIVLVNKKWLLARLPIVEKLVIGNGWWGPRNLF